MLFLEGVQGRGCAQGHSDPAQGWQETMGGGDGMGVPSRELLGPGISCLPGGIWGHLQGPARTQVLWQLSRQKCP